MVNFQEKRGLKTMLQSKPALVFLGFLIIIFTWSIIRLVGRMEETANNKLNAETKIAELQQTKDKLSADIGALQTDKGKEEMVRDKFGLSKDGEQMIVVVDDQSQVNTAQNEKTNGFITFFKNLFK